MEIVFVFWVSMEQVKTTILERIEGFRKYHSGNIKNIGKYWYSITISFVTCLYESK